MDRALYGWKSFVIRHRFPTPSLGNSLLEEDCWLLFTVYRDIPEGFFPPLFNFVIFMCVRHKRDHRLSDPLEFRFQVVVPLNMGAGN